ncbi:MAG: hypothetical protein NTX82_02725 [Candidatus Parcubacteria bacterium]|nr:hypothetical protein [Candidatus Parcubacteria bacterium]
MGKGPEQGAWTKEKRELSLEKVKEFCEQWDNANIISFINGACLAERLDDKGQQIGIYMFDEGGELREFDTGAGCASQMEIYVKQLTDKGIGIEVVPAGKQSQQQKTK